MHFLVIGKDRLLQSKIIIWIYLDQHVWVKMVLEKLKLMDSLSIKMIGHGKHYEKVPFEHWNII